MQLSSNTNLHFSFYCPGKSKTFKSQKELVLLGICSKTTTIPLFKKTISTQE
jgi:hypothetical protein